MEKYGDAHRYFVQALMCWPILTKDELDEQFHLACKMDQVETNRNLAPFLEVVKKQLQLFGLDIAVQRSEETGKDMYALVNQRDDAETASCSAYAKQEMWYLQAIIDEVFTSHRGRISPRMANELVSQLQTHMSLTKAEVLRKQFLADGWLAWWDDDLTLGTRCIMEMGPYLEQRHPDFVNKCSLCSKLVVRGVRCSSCGSKSHKPCVTEMARGSAEKCPRCSTILGDGTGHGHDSQR